LKLFFQVSKLITQPKKNEKENKRGENEGGGLRLLRRWSVYLSILSRKVTDFASLRKLALTRWILTTHKRVEMGARVGASSAGGNTLDVNVEV